MRLLRTSFLILLTGLLFSSHVLAAQSCGDIFTLPLSSYGQIKSYFPHNTNYSSEISSKSSIKNQCSLGTCHLHSWSSFLEHLQGQREDRSIKISTHYLSAMHWMNKSLNSLNDLKSDQVNVALGESVFGSRSAILKYGIIPDEVWTGNRDFQLAPVTGRIKEYISNIVASTKWQVAQEINSEKKSKIIQTAKAQIKEVFTNLVGEMPESFVYEGKVMTPQSFLKSYFPEIAKPLTFISAKETGNTMIDTTNNQIKIETSIEQVERVIRDLIDKDLSVYISYEHNASFVDKESGIMSLSAFHFPKEAAPLSRELRARYNVLSGGHAVQVVGYDLDVATQKVRKWKIKNSWGEKSGDKGYYHMYDDYFKTYIKAVSFLSDVDIQLPKAEEIKPQQLDLF